MKRCVQLFAEQLDQCILLSIKRRKLDPTLAHRFRVPVSDLEMERVTVGKISDIAAYGLHRKVKVVYSDLGKHFMFDIDLDTVVMNHRQAVAELEAA